MKIIGSITIVVVLMIYSVLLNGWALAKLWSWFMVPVFGLPALTIAAAIGIALVVGYLTKQDDISKKSESEDFPTLLIKGFIQSTFKPLFALGFGLIVKAWM